MKRFLFWFALTLVGLFFWLRVSHHHHHPRPAAGWVLFHESDESPWRGPKAYDDRDDDDTPDVRLEPAEGLPVPIVPGSRTTEARAEPPRRELSSTHRRPRRQPFTIDTSTAEPVHPTDLLTVSGRLSATEERALIDARRALERVLSERLTPGVPRDWKVPPALINGLIRQTQVVPRTRDYGTVYEATIKADFSPIRQAEIVAVYHREQVVKRLAILGTVLTFVLACLAALSGYIKADEATRGYYTTRLRLAALAALGAASVAVYRMLG